MPLFCYINTMLINRILRERGCVFVNNIDPKYLKMLIDLGSYPIIIKIQNDQRHFIFVEQRDLKYIQLNLFDFCCCTVLDIKRLLFFLKTISSTNIMFWHLSSLQSAINYNIRRYVNK